MSVFTSGNYGSGSRFSTTSFIALGLITFWTYTALRFAAVFGRHVNRRREEISGRADVQDLPLTDQEKILAGGFETGGVTPKVSAFLYLLSAGLVLWWSVKWLLLGEIPSYSLLMLMLGASSTLFYTATLVYMLWALASMRNHETHETLLMEMGPDMLLRQAAEPGNEMVARWEQINSKVVLFLVLALPMVFSPMVGGHFFMTGQLWVHELFPPLLCFTFAALFHVWGTRLLTGLYNDHMVFEADRQRLALGGDGPSEAEKAPAAEEGAEPRRELVTIMLTDMHGYSMAMEQDEARAYAKLMEHNKIMRSMIKSHHGREIKTIGDAFLVIFRIAIDAVDCALSIQRAFTDFNLGKHESDRVLVRIGIHIGDVLITGNDIFGDGVNIAARIEPLAEPGEICISEPVFEMVKKKLQLDVSKIDNAKLKNIAIAPELYRIRAG